MNVIEQAINERAELFTAGTIIRFCNYCGCQVTDQKRARKSPYCSVEHRRMAVNEKRDLRAKDICRTCGRRNRSMVKKAEQVAEKGVATVAQVGA